MTAHALVLQSKVNFADPHDCTDDKDVLTLLHAVYETLVVRNGTTFSPGLAQDWDVSEDARIWRFKLRTGAVFHDGTACDAEAVVCSLQRMARPDKGYTLGALGVWHQYLEGAEITAEPDQSVRIALRAPVADLLDILVQGFIAAPSMTDALDRGKEALPCGGGPFRVVTAGPDEVVLARTDRYLACGQNSRITLRPEPDPANRLAAVRTGAAQVATALSKANLSDAHATTERVYENPVAIIYLLNAARGPLCDRRVRRALSLAVDRAALISTARGGAAKPLFGLMPAISCGSGAARQIAPDPDRARSLLAEAGHGAGLRLRLDCPTRLPDEAEALTEALCSQLAPLGVTFDVTLHHDRLDYAHRVRRKEIGDLCVFDSSPISTFRVLYEKIDARVAGSWWQGFHNAEAERLLDLARRTADPAARSDLYADIIALLQDDPPWLTLYTPLQGVALAGNHPGFKMPQTGILDLAALPEF
ncbi:MAG: ABC transporter substrate-binding protein [Pseudomonadota bacterium]